MTELDTASSPDTSSVDLGNEAPLQKDVSYKPEAKEPEKPLSLRQALEKAQSEVQDGAEAEDKPAPKKEPAKVEDKPEDGKSPIDSKKFNEATEKAARERSEDGKFKGKEEAPQESSDSTSEVKEGEQETSEKRSSEGRGNREPPARLLPRERDEWIKAPNVVRDGIKRMEQEYEAELADAREAKENWSKLARFDEMAKSRGVTIDRALEHYTGIDAKLQQDLVGGLDHIARQYGYDLRQVAQHVLQQPADQYQQQLVQQANQIHGQNQQLQAQVKQLNDQLKAATEKVVHLETVQPFVSRVGQEQYKQLEPYIAHFLNSGMIPSNLSGQRKLETAFDMAVRVYGGSTQSTSSTSAVSEPEAKHVNPSGTKSIKGAPYAGAEAPGKKGKMSIKDSLRAAAAEQGFNY